MGSLNAKLAVHALAVLVVFWLCWHRLWRYHYYPLHEKWTDTCPKSENGGWVPQKTEGVAMPCPGATPFCLLSGGFGKGGGGCALRVRSLHKAASDHKKSPAALATEPRVHTDRPFDDSPFNKTAKNSAPLYTTQRSTRIRKRCSASKMRASNPSNRPQTRVRPGPSAKRRAIA